VSNIRQSADDDDGVSAGAGGLIIGDTSEFVRGLELSQMEESVTRNGDFYGEGNEEEMDFSATGAIDIEMSEEKIGSPGSVQQSSENLPLSVLDDEPLIAGSMAATLAALRKTGISPITRYVSALIVLLSGEIGSENSTSNFTMEEVTKREEILGRQRLRKIQREADARRQREQERQSERFNRMSQREREQYREQENQARERHEAQQRMREFEDFKFNVELEYKDEFGQEMSKKDVRSKFRYLI
jgi:U4/U6.U5 tri-snRNP-associated protein 1